MKPFRFALIAHDAKKDKLAAWAERHADLLGRCELVCTGTTGQVVEERCPALKIQRVKSGPLGGDQQIGALIAQGQIDAVVFFVDPLTAMPHDVDIKALNRLAIVYDLPIACSEHAADLLLAGLEATGRIATSDPSDSFGNDGESTPMETQESS